jgi:DNA-binding CsgD family transcriptional regulator
MGNSVNADSNEQIVDRIYEAAFMPEGWVDVMDRIAATSNSAAGTIAVFGDDMKFVASDFIRPIWDDISLKSEWSRGSLLAMMRALQPPPSFIYDADLFPEEAMAANTVRTDRVTPLGIGGEIGSFEVMPTGEVLLFTVERWLTNDRPSAPELMTLNKFRPHLMRAGLVAARLRLERASATTATLRSLGLPGAVLMASGRALAVNSLLEDLPHVFRPAAFGRLSIVHPAADQLLQEALKAERGEYSQAGRSIPIPRRTPDDPPYVVHLLPVQRSARDVFSRGDMVLAATKVDPKAGYFPLSTLIGLFDLAPAEAKLAVQLAAGKTVAEAALISGITIKTARSYLERLFLKTGSRRQAELIALLKSITIAAADDGKN